MPCRLVASEIVVAVMGLVVAGCGTSSRPTGGHAEAIPAVAGARSPVATPGQSVAAEPGSGPSRPVQAKSSSPPPATLLSLSPESFTITADDPGLQLMVTQRNPDATAQRPHISGALAC